MEAVPRETWDTLFQPQGMKNPGPRIQMLDGFNQGWIEFEGGEGGSRKGSFGEIRLLQVGCCRSPSRCGLAIGWAQYQSLTPKTNLGLATDSFA